MVRACVDDVLSSLLSIKQDNYWSADKVFHFAPLETIISFHLLVINKESLNKSMHEKTHQKLEMRHSRKQNQAHLL